MAHIRQSRPDYGLGLQVKVRPPSQVVPYSLEKGRRTAVEDDPGADLDLGLSVKCLWFGV